MTIVHGAYVIGPAMEVLADHGVVFSGSSIVQVAPIEQCRQEYPQAVVLDRTNAVLSPGFVNAHMHCYGVLAHGIVPVVPVRSFKGFLEDYWWPLVENQLDSPSIAAATNYTGLELLDSGVTSLCDVLEAPMAQEGLAAEAKVLDALGLRAVMSTEACERISADIGMAGLQENVDVARIYAGHSRISAMVCTHTAFTCSQDFMQKAKEMAKEHGLSLQFHLNESSYEPTWCEDHHGKRTCEWYASFGLLDDAVLAAQCVQVSPAEIAILAGAKVRVVHVPLSNCEVGGGVAPVPELLNHGLVCGLGTDGYINNFFEVMRGAFLIHKGHRADPTVMPARTVWRMATEMGARAVFPHEVIGRLEAGAKADIIAIHIADIPTPVNSSNLFDQLILFRNPMNVQDVIVDGEFRKKNFQLLSGNLETARLEVHSYAKRLWEKGASLAQRMCNERGCDENV